MIARSIRWIHLGGLVALIMVSVSARAEVPRHLYMQGLITDSLGGLWPDGEATVLFQLSGSNGMTYREEQWLLISDHRLSAFIGEGTEEGTDGATPTQGLPLDLVLGSDRLYIDAWIDGEPILEGVEVGSVPYAMVSQSTLSVADGSIHAEHLDASLQEALLRVPVGDFAYIKSDSVGGALGDIDSGLRYHEETIKKIGNQLTANQSTLTDINNIQGVLSGSKISDLNAIPGVLNGNKVDNTIARQSDVDAITGTIANINNVPGVLDDHKISTAIARVSDIPVINPDTTHLSQLGEVVATLSGHITDPNNATCTRTQTYDSGTVTVEQACVYRTETYSRSNLSAPPARHAMATLTINDFAVSQAVPFSTECCTTGQRYDVHIGQDTYTVTYWVSFKAKALNSNSTFPGNGAYHLTVYEIQP